MNKESKKLTWAVGLVAGLGVLSIAYAALSSTLNIKGSGESVNVGYVHFTADSKVLGIGSTNEEYGKDGKSIFSRGESNTATGMIPSTSFSETWAKAIAQVPEEVTLEKIKKEQDTARVDNIKLNDYGSFVVYELDIVNDSSNDMKLTSAPTVKLLNESGSAELENANGNVEAQVFSDYDKDNFMEPCNTPVAAYTGSDSSANNTTNYLKASGGTTKWYLRVGFKKYNEATNSSASNIKFGFESTPVWEANNVQ